jgi:hypothetical protein
MRIKIYLPVISCVVLAGAAFGFSQASRIVRWDISDMNSKQFFRGDVVVKQLLVDGVDGITVTASIKDRSDSFYAELEVSNQSQRTLDIRPQDIQLQVIQPGSKNLSLIPADVVAKRVIESENRRAFNVEAAGAGAVRTVVEHVPVTDVTSNPASLTSSRRQTPARYGGGFQVCRLVGSRFIASESSLAPLRACPALLVVF